VPPVKTVSSPGAVVADISADGRPDLIMSSNYDDPVAGSGWVLHVEQSATGIPTISGKVYVRTVSSGGVKLQGGGIQAGQFDDDPRVDLVVGAIDANDRRSWVYRIGLNCSPEGICNWLPLRRIDAGDVIRGGGIGVGDLDGNGRDEIVVNAITTSPPLDLGWGLMMPGYDYWRYRIGSSCKTDSGSCTWSPTQVHTDLAASYLGESLTGGTVNVANVVASADAPNEEIVLSAVRVRPGNDEWIIRTGTLCNVATGVCTWKGLRTLTTRRDNVTGGGVWLGDRAMEYNQVEGGVFYEKGTPEVLFSAYGSGVDASTDAMRCFNMNALGDYLVAP
jgi:hypothetical protein